MGLLRTLTGNPSSSFRDDQLEVIRRLVAKRERVLLVQRTGWGKSAVYFIATRMLRDRGGGPTLLVSPLLALMRNQIEAARRMGVRATTINSANRTEWDAVEEQLRADSVDILLISPERLANAAFRRDLLPEIGRRSGLLVIDEAHCISDWGHDFRPDYRRLVRVLDLLPPGVPVLCCTATANDRVVADVTRQLGAGLAPVRGALGRSGLALHVLDLPLPAQRLAWLAQTLPVLEGTGIIYCLTIADTERVAGWLGSQGIDAIAYSGDTNPTLRPGIEQRLLDNDVKVVVATSALGMGFDKPDLAFVIHYQSPGSPIAYYQQVGRAGRGLERSVGVLLCGAEDSTVQDFFIRSAFPPADLAEKVVTLLEERAEPVSNAGLLGAVNMRPGQLELLLKTLEVDGAIERDGSRWLRSLRPWAFDYERVESVTALRRAEQAQMQDYARTDQCRMYRLRLSLDDELAEPCGLCDNCRGEAFGPELSPANVQAALEYLRGAQCGLEPRKQWPDRSRIPARHQLQPGRALSVWGDGGWGSLVRSARIEGAPFDGQLISAAAELIIRQWRPHPAPTWVTFVPSRQDPDPVADLAQRLAAELDLPCEDLVVNGRSLAPQHEQHNSAQQWANVRHGYRVPASVPAGPVLLVDDLVDSRWTLTAVGRLLLVAGCGPVFPFVLADTAGRAPV